MSAYSLSVCCIVSMSLVTCQNGLLFLFFCPLFSVGSLSFTLAHNEKVLAKCGNSKNQSSRIYTRSKLLFRIVKLLKNKIRKAICGIENKSFNSDQNPHFANTMLSAVFLLYFMYIQIFFNIKIT